MELLQNSIRVCREAGRAGDFRRVIVVVDDAVPQPQLDWHQNQQAEGMLETLQTASLLGFKGYALMNLGRISDALPYLECSRTKRNQIVKETQLDDEIRATISRPMFQQEAAAVDRALQRCHRQSLMALNESSIVTGVTPQTLLEQWWGQCERVDVIAFYQDRKGNPWREFSNFYQNKGCGFDFALPTELLDLAGMEPNQDLREPFTPVVHCDFSEKAIMLCKAAVMGDAVRYAEIAAAETPQRTKKLGRMVSPWYQERWNRVVCGVAVEVLRQKFSLPSLRKVLLSTGDKVLCEATTGDTTWAIGVSVKMPKVYEVPAHWRGSNVLGWALMEVRSKLRAEGESEECQKE